jgi:DNA-binding transcriptional ArsR family regulator
MAADEQAVREYLEYLRDPNSFLDDSIVARVREEIDALVETKNTADPIEYLVARSALDKRLAKAIENRDPGDRLRAAFVEHAARWAKAKGVSSSAFKELLGRKASGVLVEAGITADSISPRPSSTGPRKERSESASLDRLKAALPTDGSTFTRRDLADALGRGPNTMSGPIKKLVDAGLVEDIGPEPGSRAPVPARLYRSLVDHHAIEAKRRPGEPVLV